MSMHKKLVLCSVLFVGSVAAGFEKLSFAASSNDLEVVLNEIVNQGPSESVQRTVDSYLRVVLSEKNKARSEKCRNEVGRLLAENLQASMSEFMDEIEPEDAQKLLPLFDSIDSLMVPFIALIFNELSEEKLSQQEAVAMQADFERNVILLIAQAVEYVPALKKRQDIMKATEQEGRAELRALAMRVVGSLRDVRAIVEQKACS